MEENQLEVTKEEFVKSKKDDLRRSILKCEIILDELYYSHSMSEKLHTKFTDALEEMADKVLYRIE